MEFSRSASLCLRKLSTINFSALILGLLLCLLIFSTLSFAAAPDRITGPVVSAEGARLGSGVPMQARRGTDEGAVDASLKLNYMTLVTVPTAAQRKALNKLLADQQNPHSASYHQWLTPEQYADRFGLSQSDVQKITAWLQSQGFTIVRTARGRNWIAFSGTAGQVEKAFQTEIHNFKVKGENHFANIAPPVMPAAFSGIVAGLRGLNDFRPKSQLQHIQPGYTYAATDNLFLAPGDIKTIYDINTLYQNGVDGTGYKLAVVGETGIFQSDLTNFRQNFGLSAISCTVSSDVITACNTSNFKYILVNGSAESIYGDLPEADLDIEWSGATARNAQVIFVTSTSNTGGFVWDSWYYAVDNNVAPVITMSYTAPCELAEAGPGTGEFTFTGDEAELAMANSEGITFMNSAGDTGAAECDYGSSYAEVGYAVAYPASSQYVTGVGGTLVPYTEYTNTYWGPTNGSDGGSAISYIPEQAWNDSLEFAYFCEATPNDPFCSENGVGGGPLDADWANLQENVIGIAAGGGGVSNCATVDGNDVCTGGFAQPSWQSGLDTSAINPSGLGQANGTLTRYSPDVSLIASANWPGYLVCTQLSVNGGGSSCDSPTTGIADMLHACLVTGTGPCTIFGGTSVSSPIFAGMVALINQEVVSKGIQANPGLGNINPTLYALAADNATNGAFNPVTTSASGSYTNAAWCDPGQPTSGVMGDPWPVAMQCPSSGTNLVGFNSYDFDATTGYNLATGLGSVNASHLAVAYANSLLTPTTTTIGAAPTSIIYGQTVTLTGTVAPSTATGTVSFFNNGSTTALGSSALNGGVATLAVTTLPVGTDSISASYGGDSADAPSSSTVPAVVTVTAPTFTVSALAAPGTVLAGEAASSGFTVTPTGPVTVPITFACNGLPDATVACVFTPTQIAAGASGAQQVALSITTSGPNNAGKPQRRRADNRSPWLPLALPLAGIVMVGFAGRKMSKGSAIAALCVSVVLIGFLVACSNSSPAVGVSVSPEGATLFANDTADGWPPQTATFTATVTNTSNTAVNWSVSPATGGSISSSGVYTAPTAAVGLPGSATVTATSQADTSKVGTATVTITPTTVPDPYPISVTAAEGPTQHMTSTVTLTVQ